jgi:TonB-linked SusC/RagA family outer membrane protein
MQANLIIYDVFRKRKKKSFSGFVAVLSVFLMTGILPAGSQTAMKNTVRINGKVSELSGSPLPGVTVVVKERPATGAVTDADGQFTVSIPEDAQTLVFSHIGFNKKEILIGNRSVFDIILDEMATDIEEIVVVGYGKQKKATLTGAVTNVGTNELIRASQANVSNALVGRLSGLIAMQTSGEPGKDQATLRIRGVGTFASAGGVDLQGPLIMVDGIEMPRYNNIDPYEIENVSILKDASATAVYGVRGANGVILITTKRGTVSRPGISYSGNVAITGFTNLRKNMNAYDWARSFNEALSYDSYLDGRYEPRFTEEELVKFRDHTDPLFYPDTDWYSLLFRDRACQTQHNININGGTEKVKYFISAGYFSQNGMYNNTRLLAGYDTQVKYDRYSFRTNFDFEVTRGLSLALNISNQLDERRAPAIPAENLIADAAAQTPTSGPGIWEGKIINNLPGRYSFTENSIAKLVMNPKNEDFQNQFNLSTRLDYKLGFITEGLSARATVSCQNYYSQRKIISKSGLTYNAMLDPATNRAAIIPVGEETPFTISTSHDKNRTVYVETGFDCARTFGHHTVTGLVLYNQRKYYAPGLLFAVPNGYQGIAGRITCNYDNRYLAEFNMGYNGTENFAPGKRFAFFPAYSLGWVVTEEKFFPENSPVSFLKLRGSYGEVGNDLIGGDRFLYRPTAYTYGPGDDSTDGTNPAWYWGVYGSDMQRYNSVNEGKIGNPNLTWERAAKMNIGIDLHLWENKIAITADLFKERRKQILTNQNTNPVITGANMPAYNMGEMENGGFDGEITFRDNAGKLNYWVKGIYTFAKNKIIFMDEVPQPYDYLYKTGRRYNQYFGLIAEGFYNTWDEVNDTNRPVYEWNNNKIQPGDVKYKDVNEDGKINSFDMLPIGYSDFPEITYGFSLGGEFHGFDFSILFQGADHVSFRASKKSSRGFQEQGGAVDYLKDYSWTQERYESGARIRFPHLSSSASQVANYQSSTLWVEDARYLRLKNVEAGYTFKGGILEKTGIQSARVYVNGVNLYTWHHLFPGENPEIPTYSDGNYEPYPIMRNVNFGMNINF